MAPTEWSNEELPLLSFESIMAGPVLPIEWLVESLIGEGDRVVVYGEFGSFKSWVLPSIALHLAAGQSWLDKFAVLERKRVLYIDEEMHSNTLTRRIRRLAAGMGLAPQDALPFKILSRHGLRFDQAGVASLLSGLERSCFDPQVVIVETLRRVLHGNENEAKDVGEFWRSLTSLSKGRTVIISHHMRKRSLALSASSRERASGSTDILAGADTAFAIQRIGKDALVVECTKLRAAEEPEPFVVSLYDEAHDGPMKVRHEGARPEYEAEGDKTRQAQRMIESFLRVAPDHKGDREAILASLAGKGVAQRTAERALGDMKKTGRLSQPGRGSYRLGVPANGGRQDHAS